MEILKSTSNSVRTCLFSNRLQQFLLIKRFEIFYCIRVVKFSFAGETVLRRLCIPEQTSDELSKNYDKSVVRSWVSAIPGLKFNPVSKFVYFCRSIYVKFRRKLPLISEEQDPRSSVHTGLKNSSM